MYSFLMVTSEQKSNLIIWKEKTISWLQKYGVVIGFVVAGLIGTMFSEYIWLRIGAWIFGIIAGILILRRLNIIKSAHYVILSIPVQVLIMILFGMEAYLGMGGRLYTLISYVVGVLVAITCFGIAKSSY